MNTPLAMPELQGTSLESVGEELLELKPAKLEAVLAPARGLRSSGGGGVDNTNPGAGDGDGFGLARFGEGGEVVRGVEVKVGDPQFTLIWDNDADLDLHVIEPGGKEIYWEEPKGNRAASSTSTTRRDSALRISTGSDDPRGGSRRSRGRDRRANTSGSSSTGAALAGIPKPTRWKVRIKHEGNVTSSPASSGLLMNGAASTP